MMENHIQDHQSNFELDRSHRQMAHYFDTKNFKFEQNLQEKKVPPKVTKKDIERFKKKKLEKKKIKNKWLCD